MENDLAVGNLWYLFGIAESTELGGAAELLSRLEVSTISHGNLACVVSEVVGSEYLAVPKEAADQIEWIKPRALKHHEVLQCLSDLCSILPLKFGTLCGSSEQLRSILDDRSAEYSALLERIRGRSEWSIVVSISEDAVRNALASTDLTGASINSTSDLSTGEAYLLSKRRQQTLKQAASERASTIATRTLSHLEACLPQCTVNISRGEESSHGRLTILSAAALLSKSEFEILETELGNLETEHRPYEMNATVSGPWPAYNFCAELMDAYHD